MKLVRKKKPPRPVVREFPCAACGTSTPTSYRPSGYSSPLYLCGKHLQEALDFVATFSEGKARRRRDLALYAAGYRAAFDAETGDSLKRRLYDLQMRSTYTQRRKKLVALLPWEAPKIIEPLPLGPYRESLALYRQTPLKLPMTDEEFDAHLKKIRGVYDGTTPYSPPQKPAAPKLGKVLRLGKKASKQDKPEVGEPKKRGRTIKLSSLPRRGSRR